MYFFSPIQKTVYEEGDIIPSLPQRWDVDRHNVDPVIKVLPEPALPDLFPNVLVCSANHPDICRDFFGTPYRPEDALLKNPQKLCLY